MVKKAVHEMVTAKELMAAGDMFFNKPAMSLKKASGSAQYRLLALTHYRRTVSGTEMNICVICGFGVQSVLEVAHLDQNRKNNDINNLAVLCPNCHKMHDIGLIPTSVVLLMRDVEAQENWKLRIKDAGAKAAKTKGAIAVKNKKSAAAKQAWVSRLKAAKAAG